MKRRFRLPQSVVFLFATVSLLLYQNCSRVNFGSGLASVAELKSYGGDTFDGKIRILHHYENGFTCQGKDQPESILIRQNANDWHLIQNRPDQCAALDQVPVSGVIYDDATKQAQYDGKTYVPPRPYLVDANEDPLLPDTKPIDGVCEDINGKCSLLAAAQQAGVTSSTASVMVNIPAGNYRLNKEISFDATGNGNSVTLRGESPQTTIIDGLSTATHFMITGQNNFVFIENLTFQNGSSSAFSLGSSVNSKLPLDITNCVFKNNGIQPPINFNLIAMTDVAIHKSQFTNNQTTAIQINGVRSFLIEDTLISSNGNLGVNVMNSSSNVTIRRSTISDNLGGGVKFSACMGCKIENTTIYNNQYDGLRIENTSPGSENDVTVSNSTIYSNGLTAGGSLSLGFSDTSNKLILNNSVLAVHNLAKSNCSWSLNTHNILATNSLIDDASCTEAGTGNIHADPLFGPFGNNGGLTFTLVPLLGSPLIDAGDSLTCLPTDQRGIPRPISQCDIGATEK